VVDFELFTAAEEVDSDFTKPRLSINLAAADPRHALALRAKQGREWRFSVTLGGMKKTRERSSLPLIRGNGLAPPIRTLATPFQVHVTTTYCKGD